MFGARAFSALVLLAGTAAGAPAAFAFTPQEQIRRSCEREAPATTPSALGRLLDELQDRYRTLEARTADPDAYLSGMNRILRQTPYARLLRCFDDLAARPHASIQVEFIDPQASRQTMFLQASTEIDPATGAVKTHRFRLGFSLKASVQMVFLTYLHELTHVCQAPAKIPLWAEESARLDAIEADYEEYSRYPGLEYPPELDAARAERFRAYDRARERVVRAHMLGEIEAFQLMHEAFRYFIQESPRFCGEESGSMYRDMYKAYLDGEDELAAGIFAQGIVHAYLDHYDAKPGFFFDTASTKIDYVFPGLGGEKASLFRLRPDFREEIEKLGILVNEGDR